MYQLLLMLHFLGLALGVGTGFAALTLRLSVKSLPPAEQGPLFQRFGALSKNGTIGLVLLLLSGFGMWFLRGIPETLAWGGGAFHAKLTLVLVLLGLAHYMAVLQKKARRENGGAALARLPLVSTLMLVVSVCVVITAVLAFK